MSGNLEQFGAYRKSFELFDLVVADEGQFLVGQKLKRLASRQIASVVSVCSNIEEGYGRDSTVEYRRFLIISRGFLREIQGRYGRLRRWIPPEIVNQRLELADEINRILSATITELTRR